MSSNVPKLRFKGFCEEWKEEELGHLVEFKNGINADKEAYGKGIKFINVLDILNNNYITADKIVGRVDVDADILDKYGVNYGDILFQRSSETREEVGTANVYLDKETVTFGGFVIRGKKIGDYDPTFMNSLLKSSSARKEITTKAGGSTRYNVGQDILSEVIIKLPSLEEQEKIANFLTKVDKIIEKQEEKVSNLESYKKGIMQKIFSQEIRFKDENGEEYPEWSKKKLGEVCNIIGGGTPSTTEEEFWHGNIQWFTPTEIKDSKYVGVSNRTITELGLKRSSAKILPKGTILLTTRATLGEMAILKCEATTNQGFQSLVAKKNVNNEFIYYMKDKIKKYCYTNASGSTFLEISKSSLEKFKLNLPCFEEQSKISNFLSKIDSIVEEEKEKLEKLRLWKKGLLQQMFV